jgi:flavin-binding protein dodecin
MFWREFNHSLRLPNHPNDPASEHVMTSARTSFDLVGLFDFLEDVLAWVKDQEVTIENGKVTGYKVILKVTFVLQ